MGWGLKLNRQEVLHVATLARLDLSEAEIEMFARQLSDILGYVSRLEEVDTSQVEPTFHVLPMTLPLRADEPALPIGVEEALANAPARVGTSFAVPKVIDS
jgi:aspartyl-tRNA(Asn)/glutamyl-tRNA(Gln) amidotransferase subunit C